LCPKFPPVALYSFFLLFFFVSPLFEILFSLLLQDSIFVFPLLLGCPFFFSSGHSLFFPPPLFLFTSALPCTLKILVRLLFVIALVGLFHCSFPLLFFYHVFSFILFLLLAEGLLQALPKTFVEYPPPHSSRLPLPCSAFFLPILPKCFGLVCMYFFTCGIHQRFHPGLHPQFKTRSSSPIFFSTFFPLFLWDFFFPLFSLLIFSTLSLSVFCFFCGKLKCQPLLLRPFS